MKNPSPLFLAAAFLSLVLPHAVNAQGAGFDRHLVARWTFNDGSLRSDVGQFTFQRVAVGRDPSLSAKDGLLTLGPGLLLTCPEINSTDMPALGQTITLWARIRLDEQIDRDSFVLGLTSIDKFGDWKNMILALFSRPEPPNASGLFVHLQNGTQVTSGSRNLPLETGAFVTVALVFDGAKKTAACHLDGKPIPSRFREADALGSFHNLAIGRLKQSGGPALTFDEIRVYSTAIPPEWIAEIEPVPNP